MRLDAPPRGMRHEARQLGIGFRATAKRKAQNENENENEFHKI